MTFLKFPEPVSLAIALRDPSLRFVARDEHLDQMLVLGPAMRR